jgi:pimeloyl-ACP methyl ester carboxylesterase
MVILLHMYASHHRAFDPLVPHLHTAGFAVLAIDLRGHGQSVGPAEIGLADRVAERDRKLFAAMDRDVEGAYTWLAKQPGVDPARFVLVGASVGCSVALKYAARDRSVDGIVCLTPGTGYLGIDSLADAHKYGKRQLLLMASEDERSACDELGRLVPGSVVQIVPGASESDRMARHGTRMLGQVPEVEAKITAFLVKAAGPPSVNAVLASVQGDVYHASGGSGTGQISPENIRWFSSAEEAEARGLRAPKTKARSSKSQGRTSAAGEEPFPGSEGRGKKGR